MLGGRGEGDARREVGRVMLGGEGGGRVMLGGREGRG